MDSRSYNNLMESAIKDAVIKPKMQDVKKEMKELAAQNKAALADKPLPDKCRIPTAIKLEAMRKWAIDYKNANIRASKREVRKATQKHFNIKIFKAGKLTSSIQ